jgi:hypothetical protein
MALPVTITGISTAVAPVGPFSALGTDVSQNTGSPSVVQFGLTGITSVAQSFISSGNSVAAISMGLQKVGSPTDNLRVVIYAADAGGLPTGSVLATSNTILGSSLTASLVVREFVFATPLPITSGTRYCASIQRTGANDNANNYYLQDVSSGGTGIASSFDTIWLPLSAGIGIYLVVKSFNGTGAYYFFGRDSANALTLQVYKSTAPDTSWASVRTMAHANNISNIAGCQVGNIIHLLTVQALGAGVTTVYFTFDMSTDNFAVAGETVISNQNTTGQTGGLQYGASIGVRSNGEAVAFFNGLQTNTSGTPRARTYYSRRTAVNTWSAGVRTDANTGIDNIYPEVVVTSTDVCHFIWYNSSNTAQRTLTAANVLQTASTPNGGVTGQAIGFVNSGDRVVSQYAAGTVSFLSANTPTLALAGYPSAIPNALPSALFVDGTDVYSLAGLTPDNRLYVSKSTNSGVTWGTAVIASFANVTIGTAGRNNLSRDGNIYQRGNNIVIPYLVNDGGTLKYDEYVVRSLAPPAAEIDLTVGAVTLSGKTALLRVDRHMDLGVLAVNVIGRDTSGTKGQLLTLQKGSVTLAGSTATLRADRKIFPATYSMAVAGKTATLRVGRKLQATAGAITLTGVDVNLRYGRGFMLTTQPGAVTLAGKDVDLIYTPSLITAYVLNLGTGAIGVIPTTAIVRYGHVLTAQKGAVAVGGVPANVRRAYTLSQTVGAVTLSGKTANLKYGRAFGFTAGVGAIAVSMKTATLRRNRMLSLATGSIAVTGIPADLKTRMNYKLTAQPGAIVVTGNPAVLTTRSDKVLRVLPGAIMLTGQDATLKPSRALPLAPGMVRLTGYPVILDHHIHQDYRMELAPAAVVVASQYAELQYGNRQPGRMTFGLRAEIPGRW